MTCLPRSDWMTIAWIWWFSMHARVQIHRQKQHLLCESSMITLLRNIWTIVTLRDYITKRTQFSLQDQDDELSEKPAAEDCYEINDSTYPVTFPWTVYGYENEFEILRESIYNIYIYIYIGNLSQFEICFSTLLGTKKGCLMIMLKCTCKYTNLITWKPNRYGESWWQVRQANAENMSA